MSENYKKAVYFQDKNPYNLKKNPYNPYNFRVTKKKIRTIRTFWPPCRLL